MPVPIKEAINIILARRKERSAVLQNRKDAVLQMVSGLENTRNVLRRGAQNLGKDDLREQYSSTFQKIDLSELQESSDRLLKALDAGIGRFSRDYVSIATVGKERQGKSKLLQAVGGLTNELGNKVIPAFAAGSCTGAVSVIWNTPEMEKGQIRAVIRFQSKEEVLSLVNVYIKAIDPEYFQYHTLQFDQIGRLNLQELKEKIDEYDADKIDTLKNLSKIVTRFDEIRPWAGHSSIESNDPDEIQTFVAQNNGKDSESPERIEFIRYVAVQRADIYLQFYSDVGKVRLVDTVGIGTTQYGAEEAMLHTVDQEADAAIVVTMPGMAEFQKEDLRIYRLLKDNFKNRNLKQWLYYLVNQVIKMTDPNGVQINNVSMCPAVERKIKENFTYAYEHIIDCSDLQQVQDAFIIPVLTSLTENLDEIDSYFIKEIVAAEEQFQQAFLRFQRNLPSKMLPPKVDTIQGLEAQKRGQEFYSRKLSTELHQIVRKWNEMKNDTESTILWRNIEPILDSLDSFIPSPEEISSIIQTNGAITPGALWDLMLHNIRTAITDRFLRIDNDLEEELRTFKNSLVRSLYAELHSLVGAKSTEAEEKGDMVEWLKSMMDTVLNGKDKEEYRQIRRAFQFLYDFRFNTRVQLIQEVRRQLYIINPICDEYASPMIQFTYDNCGSEIHFYLTSRMAVIEDELRYHLRKLYGSPNMAFYAAAEEFYDRLIFASDRDGSKLIDMREIWGGFFQKYGESLSGIDPKDTEMYEIAKNLVEQYNGMLDTVDQYISENERRKIA